MLLDRDNALLSKLAHRDIPVTAMCLEDEISCTESPPNIRQYKTEKEAEQLEVRAASDGVHNYSPSALTHNHNSRQSTASICSSIEIVICFNITETQEKQVLLPDMLEYRDGLRIEDIAKDGRRLLRANRNSFRLLTGEYGEGESHVEAHNGYILQMVML